MDVSAEFKQYADRVARGEDLPPFEGRILAQPNSKFPWEPEGLRKESRRAVRQQVLLWSSAALVAGLLTWTVAVRLSSPPSQAFGVAPTSTAVLSNRSNPPEASPSSATLKKAADSAVVAPKLQTEERPAAPAASNPVPPAPPVRSASALPAPSPPPQPVRVTATAPAPTYAREAPSAPPQEAGRSVPVDIAAPGALREALGALLTARAAGEATGPGATTSGGAQESAAPGNTPAPSQPSAPPSGSTTTGSAAGKEPSGESSTKGSLLVEKPSF